MVVYPLGAHVAPDDAEPRMQLLHVRSAQAGLGCCQEEKEEEMSRADTRKEVH